MTARRTPKSKERRKVTLLSKQQLQYVIERMKTLDLCILRAAVIKQVDESEAVHLRYYSPRQELWESWKLTAKLDALLKYLLEGFVEQFRLHTTGAERFARFTIAWNNFVGSVACSSLETVSSCTLWQELTPNQSVISDDTRSATVFGVASSFYRCMQQQVCSSMHPAIIIEACTSLVDLHVWIFLFLLCCRLHRCS